MRERDEIEDPQPFDPKEPHPLDRSLQAIRELVPEHRYGLESARTWLRVTQPKRRRFAKID